ncbi:MAG: F0F1 ATP synthase subunit epsilon [Nitrospirae bacterium]|nr:F0F1 ATP synthase subunit epsilon [Nitrospirota bacterium]
MDDKIRLDVVTPYGLILSEDVDELTAAGSEGEFGVLPGHVPFITTLRTGMLIIKRDGKTEYVFVSSGYAEVTFNKVVVLADSAERAEDIDVERALAARKRAEERLQQAEKVDFARATAAIERSTIRIQVAEKRSAK